MLLVIYQFVLYWIDGASGHPVTTAWRWHPALTGAALWPVFAGLLGFAYQRTDGTRDKSALAAAVDHAVVRDTASARALDE